MNEQEEPKVEENESSDELQPSELESVSGGIGGSNGVARTGSGTSTPPPTLVPLT